MTDDELRVYRANRSLRFGGGDRYDEGDLVIDPPAFAVEQLGRHLERLDDGDVGRIPRETLRKLHYNKLQHLAAEGPIDDVDGNSEMDAIIDAYAVDDTDESESEED